MTTRVLMIAHAHPDHGRGGGEIAAYNLHQRLNETDDYTSVFMARHADPDLLHGGTPLSSTGRPSEILIYATMPDWFRFSQPDKALVWRDFRQTLEATRPDIVHLHHYLFLGLELIREIRNFDPAIKIVLTLHEYWAICHNEGQMIKTDKSLCMESSPAACAQCFKKHTPQDFMLRKLFIRSYFDLVDAFISPSRFLKERYVTWGLDNHRVHVIENLLTNEHTAPSTYLADAGKKESSILRLAFFGQINWYKGLDILLDAIAMLPKHLQRKMHLDINGSGLEKQPAWLQKEIRVRLEKLNDIVRFNGPYRQAELPSLMHSAHWMVVPSRWWENSPVVILEAAKHGLPVICSNIGGMQEKVIDGVTGIHFQARRAESLAEALAWVIVHPEERAQFAKNNLEHYQQDSSCHKHRNLYRHLLKKTQSNCPVKLSDDDGSPKSQSLSNAA